MKAGTSPRKGGPRTALGKKRVSGNARTHGFFAKELHLSAEEICDYENARQVFRDGLKPDSALQDLFCDDVVVCYWRMKLALRDEQRQLLKQTALQSSRAESEEKCDKGLSAFPYPLTAMEIRGRLKLLDNIENSLLQAGRIPSEMEPAITRAFGADFWRSLNNFSYVDATVLAVLSQVKVKDEM